MGSLIEVGRLFGFGALKGLPLQKYKKKIF